jgi:hypothetical protein
MDYIHTCPFGGCKQKFYQASKVITRRENLKRRDNTWTPAARHTDQQHRQQPRRSVLQRWIGWQASCAFSQRKCSAEAVMRSPRTSWGLSWFRFHLLRAEGTRRIKTRCRGQRKSEYSFRIRDCSLLPPVHLLTLLNRVGSTDEHGGHR